MSNDRPVRDYSRFHYRLPVQCPVVLVHAGMTGYGVIKNLSANGCLLEYAPTDLTRDDHVELRIQVPEQPLYPIIIDGAVIRWSKARWHGVEFVTINSMERPRLYRRVIEALASALPCRERPDLRQLG